MNVPYDALFQNCTNGSAPPNRMTSLPEPLIQIQNNFTEMFLMMPFTKIAKWGCSVEKGVSRDIDKKYLQMISPEPLVQNQNNFTEMDLMLPSTKIDQKVQLD